MSSIFLTTTKVVANLGL